MSIVQEYRMLLAFGSNLGNRKKNLDYAIRYLSCFVSFIQFSALYKTAPLKHSSYDVSQHQYYLNCIIEISTYLLPINLYKLVIVPLEDLLGHSRQKKWQPRKLDIDIICAAKNDAVSFQDCTAMRCAIDNFFVPHVEYERREFWQKIIMSDLHHVSKKK